MSFRRVECLFVESNVFSSSRNSYSSSRNAYSLSCNNYSLRYVTRGGGGDFRMSGIRVCATGQGRFFTSKNPEQALLFEALLQNKILF